MVRTEDPSQTVVGSQPPSTAMQAHYTIHTSVLGTFVLSCVSCLCDRLKWEGLGERGPCAFRDESAEVGTKQQARRSLNSAKPIFAFLWPLGDRVNFFCSKVLQITESEHLNYGAAMLFGNPDLEPKPSKALPCDPPPLVHLLSGLMLFGLMVLSFGGSGLDAYFLVFCRPGSIRTKYFGTRVFNCRPGTSQPPVV